MAKHFFTSESVTEGHPDKVCDQIADAVLDEILALDPRAHVACEVTATTGLIHVMGEISTECYVDIPAIARGVVRDIGYDNPAYGFDGPISRWASANPLRRETAPPRKMIKSAPATRA